MIEILIVSQLPTLHNESSNMLQGGLAIFSREQDQGSYIPLDKGSPCLSFMDMIYRTLGGQFALDLAHRTLARPLLLPLNLVLGLVSQKVYRNLLNLLKNLLNLLRNLLNLLRNLLNLLP